MTWNITISLTNSNINYELHFQSHSTKNYGPISTLIPPVPTPSPSYSTPIPTVSTSCPSILSAGPLTPPPGHSFPPAIAGTSASTTYVEHIGSTPTVLTDDQNQVDNDEEEAATELPAEMARQRKRRCVRPASTNSILENLVEMQTNHMASVERKNASLEKKLDEQIEHQRQHNVAMQNLLIAHNNEFKLFNQSFKSLIEVLKNNME